MILDCIGASQRMIWVTQPTLVLPLTSNVSITFVFSGKKKLDVCEKVEFSSPPFMPFDRPDCTSLSSALQ